VQENSGRDRESGVHSPLQEEEPSELLAGCGRSRVCSICFFKSHLCCSLSLGTSLFMSKRNKSIPWHVLRLVVSYCTHAQEKQHQ